MADRIRFLALGLFLVGLPSMAFAEVMDKELDLEQVWTWALCAGLAGLVGWPVAWPVGLAAALLGALFSAALIGEITDPYVGPAIVNEGGSVYVYQSFGAVAAFAILHGVGVSLRLHRRRRAQAVRNGTS